MKQRHKDIIIAFFTFIGGLYFLLEFLLPKFLVAILPEGSIPQTLWDYQLPEIHDAVIRGVQVVGVMAIGLGIINILRVHGGNIFKSRRGWTNSLALIIGLFSVVAIEGADLVNFDRSELRRREIDNLTLFVTRIKEDHLQQQIPAAPRVRALENAVAAFKLESAVSDGVSDDVLAEVRESEENLHLSFRQAKLAVAALRQAYEKPEEARTDLVIDLQSDAMIAALKDVAQNVQALSRLDYENASAKKASHFVFVSFFTPLGSAMFSLLAFYIATAAYRSFRIRSVEALVMMIPAIIVMLGQIPHGPLYIHPGLPDLRFWLLENISTPAFRAITFGALIASLAMAVRMWLSLERSPLVADDEGGGESGVKG